MSQVEEVANISASAEMRKKEEDFDKLAVEIFSNYKLYEHVDLIAPYCLVRILPKEMFVGKILVVDSKQTNKPTWEGIVLRTWGSKLIPSLKGPGVLRYVSELSPGDHVLFPHFAGQPIPGLDSDVYRAIPEGITKGGQFIFGNDVGVIFAKVNYQRESVEEVFTRLYREVQDRYDEGKCLPPTLRFLRALRENFDISVKIKGSRTLSGR